jgi:hypothetical protein
VGYVGGMCSSSISSIKKAESDSSLGGYSVAKQRLSIRRELFKLRGLAVSVCARVSNIKKASAKGRGEFFFNFREAMFIFLY